MNDDEPRREKGNNKRREMIDPSANILCVSLFRSIFLADTVYSRAPHRYVDVLQ